MGLRIMGFQDRLKNLRQQKNLTQQELANTIFVSRSTIAKWENGLGLPSDTNLKALCDFFGVEENWLLDRNDLKEEIKTNKLQKKSIVVSIFGIILPIIFVLILYTPLYHYYYEPNFVYPMVYMPSQTVMNFLNVASIIIAFIVWCVTFLFSVLNIGLFQFKKRSKHYLYINLSMTFLSIIIFIVIFVVSIFSAKQGNYYIPL